MKIIDATEIDVWLCALESSSYDYEEPIARMYAILCKDFLVKSHHNGMHRIKGMYVFHAVDNEFEWKFIQHDNEFEWKLQHEDN